MDHEICSDSPGDISRLLRGYTTWSTILKERGISSTAVRDYESALRESGLYSEIEVHKVSVPVSGQTEGQFHAILSLLST